MFVCLSQLLLKKHHCIIIDFFHYTFPQYFIGKQTYVDYEFVGNLGLVIAILKTI